MHFDISIRRCDSSSGRTLVKRAAWVLPLLALPLSASGAGTKHASRRPDKCMARICLESPTTQKDIVAKYGPGRVHVPKAAYSGEDTGGKEVVEPDPDFTQRCYYDPKQHLYIEFNFDKHQQAQVVYNSDQNEITVSTFPMCDKKFTPKQPFPLFRTEHGVGIGMTAAQVKAAMGKPDEIVDMVKRERENLKNTTHAQLVRDHYSAVYGEKALYYSPDPQHDLLQDTFYISHGKVKSVQIGNSE